METETYKNAKMILERFDPEAKQKIVGLNFNLDLSMHGVDCFFMKCFPFSIKELESSPAGPMMTPKLGQGGLIFNDHSINVSENKLVCLDNQ